MANKLDSKIDLQRKQTMYKKDVLPARITRKLHDDFDVDNAVKQQLEHIKTLKENFYQSRQKIVKAIGIILAEDSYQYECCAVFGVDFLDDMLKSITSEETRLRNQVLGEQESVEMMKNAVSESQVSSTYLEAARMKRNDITEMLCKMVDAREKVFSALEVLRTLCPTNYKSDTKSEKETSVKKLKMEYACLNESLQHELEKLRTFTTWQKNPEIMRKQLKNPPHAKSAPSLSFS